MQNQLYTGIAFCTMSWLECEYSYNGHISSTTLVNFFGMLTPYSQSYDLSHFLIVTHIKRLAKNQKLGRALAIYVTDHHNRAVTLLIKCYYITAGK
jgi:hypothetical protein